MIFNQMVKKWNLEKKINELEIRMNHVKLLKSFSIKYENLEIFEIPLWKKKYICKKNFEISF